MALDTIVLQGMLAGLQAVATEAEALKKIRDDASKNAGTSAMDARNKTKDAEALDVKAEMEAALKRAKDLRDQLDTRLIDIGELSRESRDLDRHREAFKDSRMRVRKTFEALKAIAVDDPETLAEVERISRPVLGEDRGRKAGSDSDSGDSE